MGPQIIFILVKLVQNILGGNYEPITGICEKICIINLHNLQMLFMLWIEYKFLRMSSLPAQIWRPQWKTFWRRFCPGPQTRGAFVSTYLQIFFVSFKFCFGQKICLKHVIKTNIFLKHVGLSCTQTLKPGYGPGSAKIVSAIRIFCFEGHTASRCSIMFYWLFI